MNLKEVNDFEKYNTQLKGLSDEVGILAKKSPNDAVNKFKLKFINEVLTISNDILGKTYKPFDSFTQFDEDELPSNSDITFILSQYLNCFEKLRADNIYPDQTYEGNRYVYNWFWKIDNDKSKIKTSDPKKIK